MTRADLRRRGEEIRARLERSGSLSGHGENGDPAPGYSRFITELVFGGVWGRPGLPLEDRMVCTLAVLSALQRLPQLRSYIGAALDIGLEPRAILEVFVQCGLYSGFSTADTSLAEANAIFAARGIAVPDEPVREDEFDVLEERGQQIMAELHGERGRQGYAAPGNPITGALFASAVQYGYGELWDRPGLDRRGRMLCAVAAFTAMGLDGQVRKFSQSALNVGLTQEEIVEAIIQTGPYGGFPLALNALALFSDAVSSG
jgi:alkylhydroperoxidase/carboxymuconolactone decarboxylase family protein YurZ